MTFDDGCGSDMTSGSDLRARFATAIQESGMSFEEVCRRSEVTVAEAREAIEAGTYELHRTMPILQRLISTIGIDSSYIFQSGPLSFERKTLRDKRREARTLAWSYMLRNRVPRRRRRAFAEYIASLVNDGRTATVTGAARPPVPRTMLDVAFLYGRLQREGFFEEGGR